MDDRFKLLISSKQRFLFLLLISINWHYNKCHIKPLLNLVQVIYYSNAVFISFSYSPLLLLFQQSYVLCLFASFDKIFTFVCRFVDLPDCNSALLLVLVWFVLANNYAIGKLVNCSVRS